MAEGGIISVQVPNEIANVARRRMRLSWAETHAAGLALAERYQISFYDALIVAAALGADCDPPWSEDMQDGLVIEGRLRVVDPFRGE